MYDKKFPESEVWIGTSKIAFTPDDWVKKTHLNKNGSNTIHTKHNRIENYKILYGKSQYEIDHLGRFIKNSSKNI